MTQREFIDSREGFNATEHTDYFANQALLAPKGWECMEGVEEEPTTEDLDEMCDHFEAMDMEDLLDDVDDHEDDEDQPFTIMDDDDWGFDDIEDQYDCNT